MILMDNMIQQEGRHPFKVDIGRKPLFILLCQTHLPFVRLLGPNTNALAGKSAGSRPE